MLHQLLLRLAQRQRQPFHGELAEEARLEAGASGFAGLVLAGDWIHTGLNVGCVEATVMSGRLAANAVTGRPPGEGLVGYFPKV
jgi:uncharacterized protein with NAD-binding domain and iron-sulfur cluster